MAREEVACLEGRTGLRHDQRGRHARGHPQDDPNRRALALSGDDVEAKKLVAHLYDQFGSEAHDIGGLDESWRVDAGQKAFGTRQSIAQLKEDVGNAKRPSVSEKAIRSKRSVRVEQFGVDELKAPEELLPGRGQSARHVDNYRRSVMTRVRNTKLWLVPGRPRAHTRPGRHDDHEE
jgi:hypothetical protein